MSENQNDLNEMVEVTVHDAEVITVPIDDTLKNSGEAADAKAVGDALALKANKSELQTAVKVNGQAADNQGNILVNADDIKMSDSDQTTVKAKIEAVDGKTAADIKVSDSPTAQTIAQALTSGATRTADQIAMSANDSSTVKTNIDTVKGEVNDLKDRATALENKTGADIPFNTGSQETIKQHVDALEAGTVKTVNEIGPDEDGNIQIERVPLADNLYTEDSVDVADSFRIRTTAGSGSISDGNAWAQKMRGNQVHTGFTPESIQMTVNAATRPTPAAITASLNKTTFEAYVEVAGTYEFNYDDGAWDKTLADYGLTIANDPVDGDKVTVVWDGENDPVTTVAAVPRVAPPDITATLDRDTFVDYVDNSGTITLTYTSSWSADPALYGITITNDPISGDEIVVVYVKEVRGEITMGTPSALVATGWNLYDHSKGYAHVIKYSNIYGYAISGTYTSIGFATTPTGTPTPITPDANGLFTVAEEGYIIVTGGNGTDTAIWTTWSDWDEGYDGEWEAYSESQVNLSSIMTAYFPYGLCKVGTGSSAVYDEIDFVHKQAINRITRMAYTLENLATVKASGRPYAYDEDYIWQARASELVNAITVDEEYTISEHGLEYIADTEIVLYTEILYGVNLKDKLKRDVVTLSAQALTSGQKGQVRQNIGAIGESEMLAAEQAVSYVVVGKRSAETVTIPKDAIFRLINSEVVGRSDGIYHAAAAIPVSTDIDSTYFTENAPIPGGLGNALNSKIVPLEIWYDHQWEASCAYRIGALVVCFIRFDGTYSANPIQNLPKAKFTSQAPINATESGDTRYGIIRIWAGDTKVTYTNISGSTNAAKYGTLVYIADD